MRYVEDHNEDNRCKLSIEGTGVPMDELSREQLRELVFPSKQSEGRKSTSGRSPLMEAPIEVLNLPPRAENALYEANVVHVQELLEMSEADLNKLHYLGKRTVQAVKAKLTEKGLQLKNDE